MDSGLLEEIKRNSKKLLLRFRKKDFSGNTGVVIKNSFYYLSSNIITKIGSFIFTILMARLLMPELFGLYSLTLSTILIFAAFSEMGIGETLIRFVSKELKKNNILKAKAYSYHLIKIKMVATLVVLVLLVSLSKLIANNYYQKPIYLALLAGMIYILLSGIAAVLQSILQAHNNFKALLYRDVVVQISKVVVVPLLTLLAIKYSLQDEKILFIIILGLAFTYLLASLSLYFLSKNMSFLKNINKNSLNKNDRENVDRFVMISSAAILSGVFFGYIDIVMLGYFVSSESIGYYQAAFSFVSAIIPLITFSTAFLPVFSGLNRKDLEKMFKRTFLAVSALSLLAFAVLVIFSKEIILIVFGNGYLSSVNLLRIFSLMLISMPVITVYSTYFISIGKPAIVTRALIISTIINIILNYSFISFLVKYSFLYALYGAAVATLISRVFYMAFLFIAKNKKSSSKLKKGNHKK